MKMMEMDEENKESSDISREGTVNLTIDIALRDRLKALKDRYETYNIVISRLLSNQEYIDLRKDALDVKEEKVLNRDVLQREMDVIYKTEMVRLEEKLRQGEGETRSLLSQNDRLKSEVVKLRKLDDRVYEPLECAWQRYDVKGFKFTLPAGVAILAGSSLFGPCPICQSKHVVEVDFHITAGSSSAAIAKQYKVPVEFVVEHRDICGTSGDRQG